MRTNSDSEIKRAVKEIWMAILSTDTLGEDDNFFEIGGDSFKAAILSVRINSEWNIEILLEDIFENPTVNMIADFIKRAELSGNSDIKRVEQREYYPISWAQKRIFVLEQQFSNIGMTYNIPGALKIDGNIDAIRLEEALETIVRRHEVLRTSFHLVNGEPMQKVHNDICFKMGYIEAEGEELMTLMNSFVIPFDLSKAPLMRATLVKTDVNRHILMIDLHHIISDGVSAGIWIKELIGLYLGKEIPELKISYTDYSVWQNESFKADKYQKHEEYWTSLFSGEIPSLNLPLDYPRPSIKCFDGERIEFGLGKELSMQIGDFASRQGMTLYMVLIAAYFVLLYKYSGQEDIIIGTSAAGRNQPGTENLIGMFVNTIPIRNQPKGSKIFQEFLLEVKQCILNSFKNQDFQFQELVSKLDVPRDLSRNPLFETMFELQNMDIPDACANEVNFSRFEYIGKGAKFDLLFETASYNEEIILTIEYCTKLFKKETIFRMAGHYISIIRQAVLHPDKTLNSIEILSDSERKQICLEFNNTKVEYPIEKTIHRLFEEQAEKRPEDIALIYKETKISYGELNRKADRLADILVDKGVKTNDIVALMPNRSIEMMVGILAVLKSGAAYMPVDSEYPSARIKYMLEDSGAGILLVSSGVLKDQIEFSGEIINLTDVDTSNMGKHILHTDGSSNNLAYVIYTSGSTGNPKGVMIEHRAVHNFIKGVTQRIEFVPGKSILALTTISFDIFVLETILSLINGLTVVIADEKQQFDPKLLNRVILDNKIDMLQTTPSRMQLLMSEESCRSSLGSLKEIMVGGEALPLPLLEELKKYSSAKIYNMYGPTETTVWSAIKDLTDTSAISIGKPIANTSMYIVDKNNKLQPIGIPGDLCIGGDGLARGYLNREELTAEKFIPNPFNNDDRIYKTGDLARWLPNGEIEFLGRLDHQVKIRGYRIELEEIQTQLLNLGFIKEAVVIDKEDISRNKYLCAYIVSDKELNANELKDSLLKVLPEYMVPSRYVKLDKLPTTPNGKIDRKMLPAPDERLGTGNQYAAPENELQEKLVSIWEKVLEKRSIGINDDFFRLGGHSLLAIKLEVDMLNNGIDIEYSDLYKYRTIGELSRYIENTAK